jgi:hypothetical protein
MPEPMKRMLLPIAVCAIAFGSAAVLSATRGVNFAFPITTPANAAPASGDLFAPIAVVLNHPRCMNCHPRDDRPRQGEDGHKHLQNIVRGEDNMGFVNGRCTACHRDENNDFSGVPGAPTWHLAPVSMGWQGLTDSQLCAVLKDETKNGGKNVAALVTHMTDDKLVLWGWAPGGTRAPVSTPHPEFVGQLNAWAAAGAPCPAAAPAP